MSECLCRLCSHPLRYTFIDLGMSPLCETYIKRCQLDHAETFYPLHTYVCDQCLLVQLREYVAPKDIYHEYPYFSSYSESWLEHARGYCLAMLSRFKLNEDSLVMEIASNDGYLLQNFVRQNVPCVGIEPAANVAKVAMKRGIRTVVEFFGQQTALNLVKEYGKTDLLIGNNVLAHVPDLRDFIAGMKCLLQPTGIITMEFPHLQKLMQENQFDTIYHEHFSYLSFHVTQRAFASHGLTIFDVEQLSTHGGSLRIYARHSENSHLPIADSVERLILQEQECNADKLESYLTFEQQVCETKWNLLAFLIEAKRAGKTVVGYGAPGKGNTLLNYCGIRADLLAYTVDRSPHKQGKFTPGTHIEIFPPEHIFATRPDYVLILPWNLADEISQQMAGIREWGGEFVVPIPAVRIF